MIRRACLWVFVCCGLLVRVTAQQPLVPQTRSTPPNEARVTTTWTLTVDGATVPLPLAIAQGPSLHLQTSSQALEARSAAQVSGSFAVRATFQVAGTAQVIYGLTLGPPTSRTAFLIRSDGQWAVMSHGSSASWTPLPVTLGAHTNLQVRVSADHVQFLVDGVVVATAVSSTLLDGSLGVYAGPSADVRISGISLERSVSDVMPNNAALIS